MYCASVEVAMTNIEEKSKEILFIYFDVLSYYEFGNEMKTNRCSMISKWCHVMHRFDRGLFEVSGSARTGTTTGPRRDLRFRPDADRH